MRVRDGGDGDRVGRGARRAGRAEPEVVAVVAGGDHGHDARERGVVHGLVHGVVRRIGLGPAAGEVDDVHPVRDGRLEGVDDLRRVRLMAERRRDGEDAVVADPRLRRDAGQVRPSRGGRALPARSCPRRRPRCRRRACRAARSCRTPWCFRVGTGPGKTRATITFGVVSFVSPFGKPGGIGEAGGVEERAARVDARVDDPDLDALALVPGRRLAGRRRGSPMGRGPSCACRSGSDRPC